MLKDRGDGGWLCANCYHREKKIKDKGKSIQLLKEAKLIKDAQRLVDQVIVPVPTPVPTAAIAAAVSKQTPVTVEAEAVDETIAFKRYTKRRMEESNNQGKPTKKQNTDDKSPIVLSPHRIDIEPAIITEPAPKVQIVSPHFTTTTTNTNKITSKPLIEIQTFYKTAQYTAAATSPLCARLGAFMFDSPSAVSIHDVAIAINPIIAPLLNPNSDVVDPVDIHSRINRLQHLRASIPAIHLMKNIEQAHDSIVTAFPKFIFEQLAKGNLNSISPINVQKR